MLRPRQDRLASDSAALDEYAVNRYKPLNSNSKKSVESRFWFRPKACRNGFFTLRFPQYPAIDANQALAPHGPTFANLRHAGEASLRKVFISIRGATPLSLFPSQSDVRHHLFALTKRYFLHSLPRS
jgi:hypothetical protein